MTDFYKKREAEGFEEDDIYEMPNSGYKDFINDWIKVNPL